MRDKILIGKKILNEKKITISPDCIYYATVASIPYFLEAAPKQKPTKIFQKVYKINLKPRLFFFEEVEGAYGINAACFSTKCAFHPLSSHLHSLYSLLQILHERHALGLL